MNKRLLALGLAILSGPVAVADIVAISTDQRQGADASISPTASGNLGTAPELTLRYSDLERDWAKIYLRFDLADLADRKIVGAALTLHSLQAPDSAVDLEVFGLRGDVDSGPGRLGQRWPEVSAPGGEAIAWGNAPGHDLARGGGYWDEQAPASAGVTAAFVQYLGRFSLAPGNGLRQTFTSPQLAQFLRACPSGPLTLILTRASKSTAATSFAAKEHPVLGAPTLTLTVAPRPVAELAQQLLRRPVSVDGWTAPLQLHWSRVRLLAGRSKPEALAYAQRLATAMLAAQPQNSSEGGTQEDRLLVALAEPLRLEAARAAGQANADQWLAAYQAAAMANAADSDLLLAAAVGLAADSWSQLDQQLLLQAHLPAPAQGVVLGWYHISSVPPPDADLAKHLEHLLDVAAYCGSAPADPALLVNYLGALERRAGQCGVATFLDQLWTVDPDSPMGLAAAVLRLQRAADPSTRRDLLVGMCHDRPESALAASLRPAYLAALVALDPTTDIVARLDPDSSKPHERPPSQSASELHRLLSDAVARADSAAMHMAGFTDEETGRWLSPLGLAATVAEVQLRRGDFQAAADLMLVALEARAAPLRGPFTAQPVRSVSELMDAQSPAALEVIARVAVAEAWRQLGDIKAARNVLSAASAPADSRVKIFAQYESALVALHNGDLAAGYSSIREVAAAGADSPAVRELQDTLRRATEARHGSAESLAALERAIGLARQADDPSQAVAAFRQAADLAVALGYTQEAMALFGQWAQRFPNDPSSPGALRRCLALLENATDDYSRARANDLRKRLSDDDGQHSGPSAAASE